MEVKELPEQLDGTNEIFLQIWEKHDELTSSLGTVSNPKVLVDLNVGEYVSPKLRVFTRSASGPEIKGKTKWFSLQTASDETGAPEGILDMLFADLGEELWRLRLDHSSAPLILINSNKDFDVKRLFLGNMGLALVLPEILRRILPHLHNYQEEEDEWVQDWTLWLSEQGIVMPSKEEDKEVVEQWADDCVAMFAKQEGLLLRLAREQEK
ncbi:hypothetical protein OAD74_09000 [Alphaproteobacteria bacterium]|nr:hypothetical protein [Alphaproteobacteria bacterium]